MVLINGLQLDKAGTIISSADDGLNWSVVGAGGTFQLNSVHYQNDVWLAVGGAGMAMNSIDGSTWYKKHVVSAGTPLGTQLNAVVLMVIIRWLQLVYSQVLFGVDMKKLVNLQLQQLVLVEQSVQ